MQQLMQRVGSPLLLLVLVVVHAAYALNEQAWDPSIPKDMPVELAQANFTEYLSTLPASHLVLVEFYAHWCPHCQHFKPTYERVATFFHRANVQPPLTVVRVDCAHEGKLCNEFSIPGYPTLRVGPAESLLQMSTKGTVVVQGSRSMEGVVQWLSDHLNGTYMKVLNKHPDGIQADHAAHQHQHHGAVGGGGVAGDHRGHGGGQATHATQQATTVDLRDIEAATILSMRYILDTTNLLQGPGARQALVDWLVLLHEAHPVKSCRKGAEKALKKVDKYWSTQRPGVAPSAKMFDMHICGKHAVVRDDDWHQCKASIPNARGFTCGMWLLFHALSTRVPEGVGGALWLAGVRGYVGHFFQCAQCAQHFMHMVTAPDTEGIRGRRDCVLWMWETHNKVNARLAREELQWGDRDPMHPKTLWPTPEQCPRCFLQPPDPTTPFVAMWDHDTVYEFLLAHFGQGKTDTTSSTRRSRKEAMFSNKHATASITHTHGASVIDPTDAEEGGVEGGAEAAWVWQVVVLVTVIALVVYITCGFGEGKSAPRKPVYAPAAGAASGGASPRGAGGPPAPMGIVGGGGGGGVRAVSPSSLQPLAQLLHSALDPTAAASRSH